MSDNPASLFEWSKLLGKLQGKNGFNPKFSDDVVLANVSRNGSRIDYVSIGSGGKRILEYDREKNDWTVSERDGMRWEPTIKGAEDQKVLDQYRTILENYSGN